MTSYRTLTEAITRGRGRERSFRCPVHGDSTASASVNILKGVWVCYACGAKGTLDQIIEGDETEFLAEIDETMGVVQRIYPEGWLDQFLTGIPEYWSGRFGALTVKHFKLGYDSIRQQPCYPIRTPTGAVLGVVYRHAGEVGPKYKYPYGVNKSELLYGYRLGDGAQPAVVLTEGAPDAMAAWEVGYPAYGLYGATMHNKQIDLLHRAGVQRVGLALDNDAAGQRATHGWRSDLGEKVPGIAERLGREGFDVRILDWTFAIDAKDLCELSLQRRQDVLGTLALS